MIRKYTSDLNKFYKAIFDNSTDFKNILYKYRILGHEDLDIFVHELIDLFLENRSFNTALETNTSSTDIYEGEYNRYKNRLSYEKESFLYIIQIMLVEYFDLYLSWSSPKHSDFYIQAMFTFIYGNVKNYFFENRKRFLPEYDWFLIENNDKKKAHIEGFFREFDKFSDIISYMADLRDINDIPEDKIAYLSAILGLKFDLEEDTDGYSNVPSGVYKIELLSVPRIRSLLNGLVEVYRTKGSIFSYEIFFNALGIDISLKETFFDRRMFWRSKSNLPTDYYNSETGVGGTDDFFFYLTEHNPSLTYSPFAPDEKVSFSDMVSPKTEKSFNYLLLSTDRSENEIKNILGYGDTPIDEPYTYFKTNTLLLGFKYFMTETEEESFISSRHIKILEEYIDMITPIYIRKYTNKTQTAESVALERVGLHFYSGSGYMGYRDENNQYREKERSDGLSRNYDENSQYTDAETEAGTIGSWDEFGTTYDEHEGFPKYGSDDYGEYKTSKEITHQTKSKPYELIFNKTHIGSTESYEYTFENEDGYILNNIDFTWLPTITEGDLKEEDGYFTFEYYSYENPIVAVATQNTGGSEIIVSLEDLD